MGIHSQNMFVYCINNPVSLSDPSGTFPGYHYATLFGAQRAYEIYISKHPDAADYIVKYHMEGEDYGYYEGHPYSATWVYELIGPWTLPNNPPVPEGTPPSAGNYELGGGIKARIDTPHYDGGKQHIHVEYQGKKYAQNDDGSTSHKSGDPPNRVKKVLKKKLNWDWDGKKLEYNDGIYYMDFSFLSGGGIYAIGPENVPVVPYSPSPTFSFGYAF